MSRASKVRGSCATAEVIRPIENTATPLQPRATASSRWLKWRKHDAVLRERWCANSVRGSGERLSSITHARRRPQLTREQLAHCRFQLDGNIQRRVSLHHDGSAQRK